MSDGKLSITTDPFPLSVSILDRNLRLVTRIVSPATGIELPEGLYYVQASRPLEDDLSAMAEVRGGAERSIHLAAGGPSWFQRINFRNAAVSVLEGASAAGSEYGRVSSAANEPAPELESVWIRFAWLYDWSTAQLIRPPSFTTRFAPGEVTLTISNNYPRVVFLQIAQANRTPLNVALPPAGVSRAVRCDVTISQSKTKVKARARLSTSWADVALQYLSQGYPEQARHLIEKAVRDQPFGFFRWFSRFEDPSAALMERYVQVRTGKPGALDAALGRFLDSIPGSSDGLILTAELCAREGNDVDAARTLLRVREGALPLFSEGFRLLSNRLRALVEEGERKDLQDLRKKILRWSPYVDLAGPTLTFWGQDLSAPRLDQTSVAWAENEGWVQLRESHLPSVAVPSAVPVPEPVAATSVADLIPTDILLRIDKLTAACTQRYRFYRLMQSGLTGLGLASSFGVIAAGIYDFPRLLTLLGAMTGALLCLHRAMQFDRKMTLYRLLISDVRILGTSAKNARIPIKEAIKGLNELIRRQALL
jgi:hypothetical protein